MSQPTVMLATLCLDEMEWLPRLWEQHKDWPGLKCWCFVEACDLEYHRANPDLVTAGGLSVDGTTKFLTDLCRQDARVVHVRHGFCGTDGGKANGKAEARQRYMEVAGEVGPEFLINLDADEFYTRADQPAILKVMRDNPGFDAFAFHRREVWRPPCQAMVGAPLFGEEVVNGFWAIPCCHWWRWVKGMRHGECHNTPSYANGRPLNDSLLRWDKRSRSPCMVHMGWASQLSTRAAKCAYYEGRGEDVDPERAWYVASRKAWFTWKPGVMLPKRARVVPWVGPVPEVFLRKEAVL